MNRLRNVNQIVTKNSKFWLVLYGGLWMISQTFVKDWVEKLIRLNRNKLPFLSEGSASYGTHATRDLSFLSPREVNASKLRIILCYN